MVYGGTIRAGVGTVGSKLGTKLDIVSAFEAYGEHYVMNQIPLEERDDVVCNACPGPEKTAATTTTTKSDISTFSIKDLNDHELWFRVKKTKYLGEVFNAYAIKRGVDVKSLRFLLDGQRLGPLDTSESWN